MIFGTFGINLFQGFGIEFSFIVKASEDEWGLSKFDLRDKTFG